MFPPIYPVLPGKTQANYDVMNTLCVTLTKYWTLPIIIMQEITWRNTRMRSQQW